LIGEFFQIKFMIVAEAFRLIHEKASDINFIDSVRIPNPDKPELNIDDLRLKIWGIALRGVGATTPTSRRLRSVFSIKIDSIPLRAVGSTSRRLKYSIWLWYKSCANMM
jgi:hypothetical protein